MNDSRQTPSRPRRRFPAFSLLAALLALAPAATLLRATPDAAPVVDVTGGSIRGALLPGDSGEVFKGIPFAQPPVGARRWREPMPVIPWQGVRAAEQSGPPAEQPALGWNNADASAGSEDCLYLDVWAPRMAAAHVPVMVWIHGGANMAGAGGFDPLYDGRAFISRGVVLVVIEYRLGVLGFFAHPELTRESPHHASGNYGILDQIAALQWVHDNIAKFGGDPGNVTVFGQSAGALDVLGLMASPLSQGLFQRAIAESGPLGSNATRSLTDAERAGTEGATRLGAPAAGALPYLRSLAPADLMKVGQDLRPFTTDGWVYPSSAFEVWKTHREHAVPLVIGSNAVEFPAGGTPEDIRAAIREFFGARAPRAISLYGLDPAGPPAAADPLYGNAADQWGSDLFRCTGVVEGAWHSAANPCWEYEFDRAIPPHPRVAHSGDLPYVFGNLNATGSMAGDYTEADHRLTSTIQAYWTNFATRGDPNGPGLPAWQKYDAVGKSYLGFTTAAGVEPRENERGPFAALFQEAMEMPSASP